MEADRATEAQAHLSAFGERIRTLRVELGMSQERLAHAAGIHRAVIGFIERGEREVGITHLWPLAAALDQTISALFEGIEGS